MAVQHIQYGDELYDIMKSIMVRPSLKLVAGVVAVLITLFLVFVLPFLLRYEKKQGLYWGIQPFIFETWFKQRCSTQGGIWQESPQEFSKKKVGCLGRGMHYCNFPLPDAGKACTDSSECKGKCLLQSKKLLLTTTCPTPCQGVCSKLFIHENHCGS